MARLRVLRLLIAALMVTLLGRLWVLQVVEGGAYTKAAADTRTRTVPVPATRGQILDVHLQPLVANRSRPVVTVDHVTLGLQPDGGRAMLTRLAGLLRVPYGELEAKTRLCGPEVAQPCWPGSPYSPIPVAEQVEVERALRIAEHPGDFPGVSVELRPVRWYPLGSGAAHTLGYLQGEHGQAGLESAYDQELAGRPGSRAVAVDNTGKVVRTVEERAPAPGDTLVTSIDARIQRIAERALAKAVPRPGGKGAAVVLESATGRVVALASQPTYDPGVWTDGVSAAEYRALPLHSSALQGQWAPGSTWKVVSVAGAASAGYPLGAAYDCPSSYTVGDRAFRNFASADLGELTMHGALVKSCDTIFYRLADELWRKGNQALERAAKGFAFGAPTGVDLPGEGTGLVPDRRWKAATGAAGCERAESGYPEEKDAARAAYLTRLAKDNCRSGGAWQAGDAANLSIGQGDVLVTPLQLARAYAAVANGGTVFSPRVGLRVLRPDGEVARTITPPVTGRLPASASTLAFIRAALADVPRTGTASGAFAGFPFDRAAVAGKTGTAEAYGRQDTSWFASFAPDPGYTVVVVVSEGGRGAEVAAPAAREIWEGILS
ncbi:MAG: penicillin-binding protein 2 [Thermoactinospora sp.]|nr:penicillin-binding protein 2 [Thermoactinospora sp.]